MNLQPPSIHRGFRLLLPAFSLLACQGVLAFDSEQISCDGLADTNQCVVTIAPAGGAAIQLRTQRSNISPNLDGTGFVVHGDTYIVSPAGEIPMRSAELVVEYADPSNPNQGLRRLHGTAEIPFPQPNAEGGDSGLGGDIGIYTNARAEIGLELGSNLMDLGAHVNPARECMGRNPGEAGFQECPYLFFHAAAGAEIAGGFGSSDLQWSLGADLSLGGASATFVLDPFDPYFYLGASGQMPLQSVSLQINPSAEAEAGGEDFGFGFSRKGLIPFWPETTYGIQQFVEENHANFTGHLVVDYVLPIGTLPLEVDGTTVFQFPVELDGAVAFNGEFQTGSNGDVNVGLPFFDELFSLEFPLGNATVGARLNATEQFAYFSGEATLDAMDFLPGILPLQANSSARVYGVLSNRSDSSSAVPYLDVSGSFAAIEADYLLDLSLGNRVGGLRSGVSASGMLRLSASDGMTLRATLGGDAGATALHPMISLSGTATAELAVDPFNPQRTHYLIRGDMALGEALDTGAELFISPLESYASFALNYDGQAVQRAVDDASASVEYLQSEVDRLDQAIVAMRATVTAEREANAAALEQARSELSYAQSQVDSLQSQINYNYQRISVRRAEIKSWYNWYKAQPWYNKTWAWAKYVYQKSWRETEIAGRYVTIGGLVASKEVAMLTLEVAKQNLNLLEQGMALIPVDADPRISTLIVSKESATVTLQSTLAALAAIPQIPGTITATAYAVIEGINLRGEVRGQYCDDRGCSEFAGGSVDFGKRQACVAIEGVIDLPICTPF